MPNLFYSQFFVTPKLPKKDLSGQTIIVTGANVGLGFEAAKHFANMRAERVILACRDQQKGNVAADQIRQSSLLAAKTHLEVWSLDLSSYASIEAFGKKVNTLTRLDAVVANAGILTKQFKLMEGNESTITVNVISTILMGMLVLPKLRESAKANKKDGVLTFVGSEVYTMAKFTEQNSDKLLATLNSPEKSNMGDRYNVSKLLLLFAVRELAKQNPISDQNPVLISVLTPGFCKSSVFRDTGFGSKMMNFMAIIMGRETEVGSRTLVDAAVGKHGRNEHGEFLWDNKPAPPTGFVPSEKGQRIQKKLWSELNGKLEEAVPGVTATA
nr:hypothetical protein B0A51_01904 [Rachicladosporium sp. CCFEE 5018]